MEHATMALPEQAHVAAAEDTKELTAQHIIQIQMGME
jgi:hypothetical protein